VIERSFQVFVLSHCFQEVPFDMQIAAQARPAGRFTLACRIHRIARLQRSIIAIEIIAVSDLEPHLRGFDRRLPVRDDMTT
jgi:hypothetical protein